MKKILFTCLCLLFISNLEAKEYVYKTKLYGDFIFNDITNRIVFRRVSYIYTKSEEIENGFNVHCTLNGKKRMFELYSTETSSYLVEYEINIEDKKTKGVTLYYEGIGEISANEITSNVARNKDLYFLNTGADDKDQNEIMRRVSDIIRLINKGGLKVNANGAYSFNDPEFAHLKSKGEFNKSTFGKYKKDGNYYNNLAFNIIGQAIKDASQNDSLFTEEERFMLEQMKAGLPVWKQVLKTEIVSYEIQ